MLAINTCIRTSCSLTGSTSALKDPKSFEVTATLTKPSQSINVYMTSVCWNATLKKLCSILLQDTYAGVTVSTVYKPNVGSSAFPVMDTRPQDSLVRVHSDLCRGCLIVDRQGTLRDSRM